MTADPLYSTRAYMHKLCTEISERRVGSRDNRQATNWFAEVIASLGWQTTRTVFDCLDWQQNGADLIADGMSFEAFVSPYSLGCQVSGPLVVADTPEQLKAIRSDAIVLLKGELTREPLMPKNFEFYNPDHHKRIIHLLEEHAPQAIIAATGRSPEMAGAVYPFPLTEDGDFDIPSVYMTAEEGVRLGAHAGREISLKIRAERRPSTGYNVLAHKGPKDRPRIVIMAHIDTKPGTPGAIDNATGIASLLLLAQPLNKLPETEMLASIEMVAMNGEDYYSNPGEMLYLAQNAGRFDQIILGINLDGAGYYRGRTAYSLYHCPPELMNRIETILEPHTGLIPGDPWFQGDHSLFLMHERPALALTSEYAEELLATVVHTPQDTPEIVDATKLVEITEALNALLFQLATEQDHDHRS